MRRVDDGDNSGSTWIPAGASADTDWIATIRDLPGTLRVGCRRRGGDLSDVEAVPDQVAL